MDAMQTFIRENAWAISWAVAAGWAVASVGALRCARNQSPPVRRLWIGIAVLALGFGSETVHPFRFALTDQFREALRALGGPEAYGNRRPLQVVLIACLVAPLSALLAVRLARTRAVSGACKIALLGAGIGLVGFALETISLHYIDAHPSVYRAPRFCGLVLTLCGVVSDRVRARPAPSSVQTPR